MAVRAIRDESTPTGTVGALLALADLREALATIRFPSPLYEPGTEPTAADACHHILNLIEHGIRQVEVFVGPDRRA